MGDAHPFAASIAEFFPGLHDSAIKTAGKRLRRGNMLMNWRIRSIIGHPETVQEALHMARELELIGENYSGKWERTRTACRGIVIREGHILLSYETSSRCCMIPGGGLEPGEDEQDGCIREVAEETGFLIRPSPCILVIHEYVWNLKHTNRYFAGEVIGRVERNLTERERLAGMGPRWYPLEDALAEFCRFQSDESLHPMWRGLYRREYTALTEFLRENPAAGDA
jgi:8-oxo-dGTP pyrophosphatase MutT (NUDIX family)